MARNRKKGKPLLSIPREVVESRQYAELNGNAVKLMVDLHGQYRGYNNGDLCAAYSIMKKRGWRSKGTLQTAIDRLKRGRWILVTRQGGRNKPSLYGLTYLQIDECGGKLDIQSTTKVLNDWAQGEN